MIGSQYMLRTLPESLNGLAELAIDTRWSWNHTSQKRKKGQISV